MAGNYSPSQVEMSGLGWSVEEHFAAEKEVVNLSLSLLGSVGTLYINLGDFEVELCEGIRVMSQERVHEEMSADKVFYFCFR